MEKLVSIIMGVYNCEKTVRDAIESIIKQTYANWELIICDNNSTDNTFEIVKEFQEKDNRIVVVKNEKNLGLAYSLNRCISLSKGEYIARMDSDDICMENRLAEEVCFLNNNPEFAVCGSAVIIFDDLGQYGVRFAKELPLKEDLLHGVPFLHPTIMIRSEVIKKLGGYIASKSASRAEDLNLWFRFYAAGFKGYNLKKPLYYYREGLKDYKKKTLKAAIKTRKVFLEGYKMIGIKGLKKIYAFKPILSALIPNRIAMRRHRRKLVNLEKGEM